MEITKVLLTNYLPYAKGTIIGRAIPSIDGLKPAQRRILYSMYNMGLQKGNKAKSSRIVGETMKIHPHGDMAIYETMVRMASGHDALNVPYVDSKGNFGKVYSKSLAFAAPRYTEAKLAEICAEMFDGINDGAVEFIDNFDNTMKEPTLLPVKFPTILVNPSNGIAVGTSSSIPSFDLTAVCDATIGILNGNITDVDSLMQVLGAPEFTTGGYIHADENDLKQLGKTGKHSFTMSGSVTTYPNKIIITEIPYKTTAEAIVDAIESYMKTELKEVSDVLDAIDLKGFRIEIDIKRGQDPHAVLKKICRLTPLRSKMSFTTRVIVNDRCEDLGLLDLLHSWIDFRMETIRRINEYRFNKASEKEHLLAAWEKIKLNIKDVANLISNRNEVEARTELMSFYNLDEIQADYILDMKIRMFTHDNLKKKLDELDNIRTDIAGYRSIIDSDDEKRKIIVEDLTRIKTKYGKGRKTHQVAPLPDDIDEKDEVVIDDTLVNVVLTKNGYLKRLVSIKDISNFEVPDNDKEIKRWAIKNNEYLLVFTYSGDCYKVLVDSIDASRGGLKDKLVNILGLSSDKEILFIDASGDYSGYFNLVYPNGRGTRVYYNKVSGKRSKYKSLYDGEEPGKLWLTKADKFFMITARRKAAYCDLSLMGLLSNRVAFKVARVGNDTIFGLQPIENVPNIDLIDLDRYHKEYTVSIGSDELWKTNK